MCIRPAVFNQLTLAAMSIHNGINRMNADVASVFFYVLHILQEEYWTSLMYS